MGHTEAALNYSIGTARNLAGAFRRLLFDGRGLSGWLNGHG
jgi:hypothetical protein